MIYELKFDSHRFQPIYKSIDFNSSRYTTIGERWDGLEAPGGWYHMTGLGSPVQDSAIKQRFFDLFADYPNEMSLGECPQDPGDIVLDFRPPVMALSTSLESGAPVLLERISSEGVVVDYPYGFSLERMRNWMVSKKTLRKWPQLKDIEKHPVEIEDHGSKYLVCDPVRLEGYRIKLYYCTNWQHDLVDRELTNGEWHTWAADGDSARYYKAEPGASIVVFKRMPSAGTCLFRIPESTSRVFCTRDFKDAYEAHGLKGLIFKPMALSESNVPPPPPPPCPKPWEERA